MTRTAVAFVLLWCVCLTTSAGAGKTPLTVGDLVENRRVITGYADPILLSPDGSRYVIVTCRGDVAARGSWLEFFVGSTTSIQAAKPRRMAKKFTKSTASAFTLVQQVRWQGNRRIAFLLDDGLRSPAAYSLDIVNGWLSRLTNHPTPILQFDLSQDGRTLVYTAIRQKTTNASVLHTEGGYVTQQTVYEVLAKSSITERIGRDYDTFVSFPGSTRTIKLEEPRYRWGFLSPDPISVSPDGKYAVVVRPATHIPTSWDVYTAHLIKNYYLPMARSGGDHLMRQLFLVDLKRLTVEPLWNAPQNPWAEIRWSQAGNQFVIGPVFPPAEEANGPGLEGRVVAVVDAATRKYQILPITDDTTPHGFAPRVWDERGMIEVRPTPLYKRLPSVKRFQNSAGYWMVETREQNSGVAIQVLLRQGLNEPPVVTAEEAQRGSPVRVLEINPELEDKELGQAELIHWKSRQRNDWTGVLFLPVHFQDGKRYPLVIQTHGYTEDFTLDGGIPTAYAARLLAAHDIAVLQLGGPDDSQLEANSAQTPEEPEVLAADGYLGAIDSLAQRGLVDTKRVGIVGWSRTGWHVGRALFKHPNCFAAAITADIIDGNYVQYVLSGATAAVEGDIGANPFGAGLEAWKANATGFNLDKVTTPLRIEQDSGGIVSVLNAWEMYAGLRRLGKPVDLYVIPDIEHGEHELQHPLQRRASIQGSLDWFRFWLLGEEDPDPTKVEQYRRWEKFRDQQPKAPSEPPVCR